MATKYKVMIVLAYTLVAVAVGRYTVPEKVKIETKIVEVEKKTDKDVENKTDKKHKQTIIVKNVKPDGASTTTTTITYDDNKESKKNDTVTDNKSVTTDTSKEVVRGDSKVTISALAGASISTGLPAYGLSVTKPILGPLTVGLWGLNNGTCGGSVGITF